MVYCEVLKQGQKFNVVVCDVKASETVLESLTSIYTSLHSGQSYLQMA